VRGFFRPIQQLGAVPFELIATVSKFYGWGPRDALELTRTELLQWLEAAHKITKGSE
jgi:hypothetical protein